jgi:adenylosuccinate lyase
MATDICGNIYDSIYSYILYNPLLNSVGIVMHSGMFESVLTKHWFSKEAVQLWNDHSVIQLYLDIEAALARAQADLGLIPKMAADAIAANADVARIDFDAMARDVEVTLHPFVPLLRQFEALCPPDAAGYIHWGVTTQNIFDTADAIKVGQSNARIDVALSETLEILASVAATHRLTVQAGRTHGQHALPITFGQKVVSWMAELRRAQTRLNDAAAEAAVANFGGAVGTFAAMGGRGRAVQDRVAVLLKLKSADVSVRSSFDRVANYVAALGLMSAGVERIAQEIVFMQRTEIDEVTEAFNTGKVGSSTMAQKRNPSHALNMIGLARMLRSRVPLAMDSMVRPNEGDSASGNVSSALLPEVCIFAISLAEGVARLVRGMRINVDAMRRNINSSGGLIMSEAVMMQLAPHIGRHHAHDLLYEVANDVVKGNGCYRTALAAHPTITKLNGVVDLDYLLNPANYVGESEAIVNDELARFHNEAKNRSGDAVAE